MYANLHAESDAPPDLIDVEQLDSYDIAFEGSVAVLGPADCVKK